MDKDIELPVGAHETPREDLDRLRFELEARKWREDADARAQDRKMKADEIGIRRDELEIKKKEAERSRWTSPLVVAIFGGALAATGNFIANYESAREQRHLEQGRAEKTQDLEKYKADRQHDLEREKAEAARILEVVKTADPDKAAVNLKFLMESYLIADDETRRHVQNYIDNREPGQGFSLPAASGANPPPRVPQVQALPPATGQRPYHLDLAAIIGDRIHDIEKAQKIKFQVTGNTGGVKRPEFQAAVALSMKSEFELKTTTTPEFLYILGNLTYYWGEERLYLEQFYRPYAKYPRPIFAIPGNHDAETPPEEPDAISLAGYMRNLCAKKAVIGSQSGDSQRATMTEPNSYWSLQTPFVTIIGLYTNAPEQGFIDADQQTWLVEELKAAPKDKAVIIAMHKSPILIGIDRNGSNAMAIVLQNAINASKRVPNMVLSATANLYQRQDLQILNNFIPFVVVGTGGYWNLFRSQVAVDTKHPLLEAVVKAVDDRDHGYMSFEIGHETIKGSFIAAPSLGDTAVHSAKTIDTFEYTAKAIFLTEETHALSGSSTGIADVGSP